MHVKEHSYVNIQSFMVNDLHLSGNELIIFACIHGFSQDGKSWFTGSRAYLASWCQASKTTVSSNLSKLCEKGFLEKRTRIENGVTFNDYRVYPNLVGGYKKLAGGLQETDRGGMQEICPHNIEIDTNNEKDIDKGKRKRFTAPTLEEVSEYCKERNNSVDPQRWFDYYSSNGWMVGRNKMKDWKAAVRTWERNNFSDSKPKQSYRPNDESEWDF